MKYERRGYFVVDFTKWKNTIDISYFSFVSAVTLAAAIPLLAYTIVQWQVPGHYETAL